MKSLGLGIIGLHHQHPRWYHPLWKNLPEYEPRAIAESDGKFLASENEFFRLDAYDDYRKILERDDIDVVIIWLPHSEMPKAVELAAAAGKHVIVEKPCAATLAGAEQIAETAKKYPNIKISSPYCWRTHPVSGQIRKAVVGGLIGEIRAMEARLNAGMAHRYIRDNSAWTLKASEGGGPMWNLGVHWVDYFRWMTGKEVVSICGAVSRISGGPQRDIEDNSQAVLTFEDGATAILDISYSLLDSYPGKRDIYVSMRGNDGNVSWEPAWQGVHDEFLLVSSHEKPESQSRRIHVESKDIPGYCGEMAWTWLKDFAAAVNENRQPMITVDDIIKDVKVVDAFYKSLKTGAIEKVF
ncbi:MAG TPA: Gfo/Idh/MocA family oxidoreductase [Phycisphaerae bacterium]|nr:Gfo/Idh/MocA family oxidoreductase [Phycisphaerae bacterium]HPS53017.1 Gfo/Idh/MocA family oxidoreductase [Phycisphaerae bacterium]